MALVVNAPYKVTPPSYSDTILGTTSATIEGYWTNDAAPANVLADSSGNGRDFTKHASASVVAGQVNNGVNYNGAVNVYSTGTFSFTANYFDSWSAEAWINSSEDPGVAKPFIELRQGGGTVLAFSLSNGTSFPSGPAALEALAGGSLTKINNVISLNTFHHVAVSYQKNSNVIFYVDGSSVGTLVGTPNAIGAIDSAISGGRPSSFSFAGIVDELVLYSGLISAADVLTHYQAGL